MLKWYSFDLQTVWNCYLQNLFRANILMWFDFRNSEFLILFKNLTICILKFDFLNTILQIANLKLIENFYCSYFDHYSPNLPSISYIVWGRNRTIYWIQWFATENFLVCNWYSQNQIILKCLIVKHFKMILSLINPLRFFYSGISIQHQVNFKELILKICNFIIIF